MKTINDINFAELYRNHISLATREPKQPQDWDRKVGEMQQRGLDLHDGYVDGFLARMDLNQGGTLLDVGCGGGAIALSAASYFSQVYALDFSPKMLALLRQRASGLNIANVKSILRAWEDNWDDIPQCDVCVSSRSSMVNDLQTALDKLNAKAKRAVYMTMTVEKDFIDRDVLHYIGRDGIGFPSYIYAVNILYRQGYRVKVDFLDSARRMVRQPEALTEQDFIHMVKWSIGSNLTETELSKLRDYFRQNQCRLFARPGQKVWAFLSWNK